MAKSKYVTEAIRLPANLMAMCNRRAKRMGVPMQDFIVYVMLRAVDDYNLALDAAAEAAQARETLKGNSSEGT